MQQTIRASIDVSPGQQCTGCVCISQGLYIFPCFTETHIYLLCAPREKVYHTNPAVAIFAIPLSRMSKVVVHFLELGRLCYLLHKVHVSAICSIKYTWEDIPAI